MKLTKIETSPRTRINTTVGTRVFAGDTMIFGDTGWRNVRGTLVNGWTASGVQIRRINAQVFVKIYALRGVDATDRVFLPMPEGFNWGGNGNVMIIGGVAVGYSGRAFSLATGLDYFTGYFNEGSLVTNNPWPTSLPGTPA